MLVALRTVASRATETQAPATHEALVAVESELAPFFALAPPPSADPDAPRLRQRSSVPSRASPRARKAEAVALLGCLPALSPATVRAVAHAALAPRSATEPLLRKEKERHLHDWEGRREDAELLDDVATRAVDAVAANVAAAPLALSTSFFAAVLTGAPEWDRAERVAGAAARALVDLGDADAWAGAALAWGAVATARRRARASSARNQRGAEGRALFGALRLAAAAAEASSHETDTTGNVVEKLAPRDLEEDVPTSAGVGVDARARTRRYRKSGTVSRGRELGRRRGERGALGARRRRREGSTRGAALGRGDVRGARDRGFCRNTICGWERNGRGGSRGARRVVRRADAFETRASLLAGRRFFDDAFV
jgi:pre-rRNA-processing protein IPI1